MKKLATKIIAYANHVWLVLWNRIGPAVTQSELLLVSIFGVKGNTLALTNASLRRTRIQLDGKGNLVEILSARLSQSEIQIIGDGNRLFIGPGVRMHGVKVVIRGKECSIAINSNTTLNGGRLVSAGRRNSIDIGEDCMFSDQVEIWASDTHPIYDDAGQILNCEEPIRIGDSVWLGVRVTVLKGVVIGNGSVIGMGSVVTADVPEKSISVGHPNRTLRSNVTWGRDQGND